MERPHPFDPLTAEEITRAAGIVRPLFTGQDMSFRIITLKEPLKKDMIVYLDRECRNEQLPIPPPRMARVQVATVNDLGANQLFELILDLDTGRVITNQYLDGRHPYIDSTYMQKVEAVCIADERVQREIATLNLPHNATVVVEAWAYATDGMNDMSVRTTMCWFYMRLLNSPDANYYAYPLDICAEVSEKLQVTKVYRLPSSKNQRIRDKSHVFDERKVQDTATSEYHPALRPAPRLSTKPLHVVQPEGESFQTSGNYIEWERWRFHLGFNYREGLTLHNICYDGRSVFYRLSLVEMFVPYGDPRTPYPRKAAFDLGNDGAGVNANNLKLGCDCLGHVRYFDWWHHTPDGQPKKMPNVVCCHEQDDGILWKHTNFRTGNAVVTRSRVLVLQTIITVSNYEYIFAFHFGQDASIHYEVRATGILSTAPIHVGDSVPYGTVVAPGVLAPYHQHLFCLRIDPAIDGHANSLVVEESHALPITNHADDEEQIDNPFGVGYVTSSTVVERETGLDLSFEKNRTFKLINEHIINPVTGTPVGYKIVPSYSQMLLADASSFHAKRSEFAAHAVWVTRYDDEEAFPSGRHTMQSLGGEGIASGIAKRAKDKDTRKDVRNEDIVVWHTFGSTHNPRVEDWPIMPAEKMVVGLKPVNFFTGNPALDVAAATQEHNRSVLVNRQ